MILKKIMLKNIRSYESAEIDFPIGSTVLAGDIGTGKSSILLALEFVLFGLQPGQKGSSLLRNGTEDGSVLLVMEIDGIDITIERGLKRTTKTVNQSYAKIEYGDIKEDISVTELKNKVLDLLNYPKEFAKKTNILYRFTVYTPQDEMRQIILETPETRLNTLRHIFGIDKYKRIRENSELVNSKLREEIRSLEGQIKDLDDLNKKITEKKSNINVLEGNILILEDELKTRKKERMDNEQGMKEIEDKIKEKEKYEREAEKTEVMLIGKKELISRLEKEINQINIQIHEAKKSEFSQDKLKELEIQLKIKEKEVEDKNKQFLDYLTKIKFSSSKISENEKMKEQIYYLKLCPTCFQDVTEDYKKNILRKFEEEIEKHKKELAIFENEKSKISSDISSLKSSSQELDKNLKELNLLRVKLDSIKEKESRIIDLDKQKTIAEKDISFLISQINTMKESASLLKKYDQIFQTKQKDIQNLLSKEKEKEIELARTKKEKEMTLTQITEINKEILHKENLKQKLIYISEIEDWIATNFLDMISFTERNIMLKLREEFSKLFNEWFNILVPEIFTVKLDEDFTPIIEQQDYQLDYNFLSGGERTAIALAYRLALNQVLNSLLSKIKTRDIVILDEPTDGFSEQQLDKMRDVLQELKVQQLIIVSHEPKIESFVDNIIKFRKEEGITRIET